MAVQRRVLIGTIAAAGALLGGTAVAMAGDGGDDQRVELRNAADEETTTTTEVTTTTEATTTTVEVTTTTAGPATTAAPTTTAAPATTTTVAMVSVPSVIGLTEANAVVALERAGFSVSVSYQDFSDPNDANKGGAAVSQSLTGNAPAPAGSPVALVVGRYTGPASS